jgi:hypothetical protein
MSWNSTPHAERGLAELRVGMADRITERRVRSCFEQPRDRPHHPSVRRRADLADVSKLTVNDLAEEQSA